MHLQSAIVDCCNEDTRSNELNFVHSLEDVLYITGLPVDGLAIGHNTEGTYTDMCSKYLGENGCITDGSEVCFSWLKEHFEMVPKEAEKNSPKILPFVRAFLMYILGSVVFPTKSGDTVSVHYLPLLQNMDEMDKYAWGANQLVHLHKSLSDCKKKQTKLIAGHTYSLLFFAMEHIPKLALHLTGATLEEHNANLPKSFPLLVGWAELLEKSADKARKTKDKAIFKQTLNRIYEGMRVMMIWMRRMAIVWQPYTRLRPLDQFLPSHCIGQQKIGMSQTVLICFERFAYHRPNISPKQFGLKESCLQYPLVELGRLKRLNGRTKDLGKDEKHNTLVELGRLKRLNGRTKDLGKDEKHNSYK
ncbi:hypothetical protein RHGRI_013604 [Rhododendron griersonianum]|uniref:Aminotransferase-like plant mobile domain-containing protein n=1 Tax=Rhododendron griersonianum TaxID=479676 RepID=A0AAV6K699_9ERIC|nr:hypothetical protein RHGRI_013604 [Rhododendron griersonianum]